MSRMSAPRADPRALITRAPGALGDRGAERRPLVAVQLHVREPDRRRPRAAISSSVWLTNTPDELEPAPHRARDPGRHGRVGRALGPRPEDEPDRPRAERGRQLGVLEPRDAADLDVGHARHPRSASPRGHRGRAAPRSRTVDLASGRRARTAPCSSTVSPTARRSTSPSRPARVRTSTPSIDSHDVAGPERGAVGRAAGVHVGQRDAAGRRRGRGCRARAGSPCGCSSSSASTPRATSAGTAKPVSSPSREVMPTTRPSAPSSGPPEVAGSITASVSSRPSMT